MPKHTTWLSYLIAQIEGFGSNKHPDPGHMPLKPATLGNGIISTHLFGHPEHPTWRSFEPIVTSLVYIAIFLILKLRSVLGTRDGFEKPPIPLEDVRPRVRRARVALEPLEARQGGRAIPFQAGHLYAIPAWLSWAGRCHGRVRHLNASIDLPTLPRERSRHTMPFTRSVRPDHSRSRFSTRMSRTLSS